MEQINKNFIQEQIERLENCKSKQFTLKETLAYLIYGYNHAKDKSSSEQVIESYVTCILKNTKEELFNEIKDLPIDEISHNSWRLNYIEILAFAIMIFNNSTFNDHKVTDISIKEDLLFYKEQGTMLNIFSVIQRRYNIDLAYHSYELFY